MELHHIWKSMCLGELKGWLGKWKVAVQTNQESALQIENAAHALPFTGTRVNAPV